MSKRIENSDHTKPVHPENSSDDHDSQGTTGQKEKTLWEKNILLFTLFVKSIFQQIYRWGRVKISQTISFYRECQVPIVIKSSHSPFSFHSYQVNVILDCSGIGFLIHDGVIRWFRNETIYQTITVQRVKQVPLIVRHPFIFFLFGIFLGIFSSVLFYTHPTAIHENYLVMQILQRLQQGIDNTSLFYGLGLGGLLALIPIIISRFRYSHISTEWYYERSKEEYTFEKTSLAKSKTHLHAQVPIYILGLFTFRKEQLLLSASMISTQKINMGNIHNTFQNVHLEKKHPMIHFRKVNLPSLSLKNKFNPPLFRVSKIEMEKINKEYTQEKE